MHEIEKRTIDAAEFVRLTIRGDVVEKDAFGPKVIAVEPSLMVKLFRRKRLVSSAIFRPYAARFVRNAARLRAVGIQAPRVKALYHCPERGRHLVIYEKISGTTVREILQRNRDEVDLMEHLGRLFATLHGQGIYFRSLHLGNVLRTDSGTLALIDVADLRWRRRSLGLRRRLRNFAPLVKHAEDGILLAGERRRRLLNSYIACAGLSTAQASSLNRALGL